MDNLINDIRTQMRRAVAQELRDFKKENANEIDPFARTSLKEMRKIVRESSMKIDEQINELNNNKDELKSAIMQGAKEEVDKSGLSNSIKPKWIKHDSPTTISYKNKKPTTKSNSIVSSVVAGAADPVNSDSPKHNDSVPTKIWKSLVALLQKIEKNTREHFKNTPSIQKQVTSITGLLSKPAGQGVLDHVRLDSKQKRNLLRRNNRGSRNNVSPTTDDSISNRSDIVDRIQENLDPISSFTMHVARYQLAKHNKRKEAKLAKKEEVANKEREAALRQPKDDRGLFRKRTPEEQKKYEIAKAATTSPKLGSATAATTPSGEPESKSKYDLKADALDRIQDDPTMNAAMASGGGDSGGGIGGVVSSAVELAATGAGKLLSKIPTGLGSKALNAAKLVGRFAGPAAAVAGAGAAGYAAGNMFRNSSWGDKLGLSDAAAERGESLGGKAFDYFNGPSDEEKKPKAKENTKVEALEKQQKKADDVKKAQAAPQVVTVPSGSSGGGNNNVVNNMTAATGKGIGTRNVDSSFTRYLDSRTNFA